MTFTFDPPWLLLFLIVAIFVVVAASVAVGKKHRIRKALGLIIAAVALTVIVTRVYEPDSVTVEDGGIVANTYGEPRIPWSDVEQAIYIPRLATSEYRPTRRMGGTAFGGGQTGWFGLANGDRALVALQGSRDAVLIATRDTVYLFGPTDAKGFAQAIAEHVPLSGPVAAQGD